jgi:AAA-like domain
MANAEIYTVGGTVQAGGGIYIPRQADDELLDLCRAGTFAYVLSSRQMGKSSLMVRTLERLTNEGVRCVIIDLNEIGTQINADAWYLGLLTIIEQQLELTTNPITWWHEHERLGPIQRLTQFLQTVLLAEVAERVVVFIDEIDTTLSLTFTDDFYAAIRSLYTARARVPAYQRLSFVLIGVATPSDLIRDPQRTPFNIGQRVDVTDFTFDEALPLTEGLGPPPTEARQLLGWILEWTGGHPYLTQRLCSTIAFKRRSNWAKADLDQAVGDTFFGATNDKDQNLQFVRDMLTKGAPAADRASVLLLYREIRLGFRTVRDEEQSVIKTHLKLSGIVRRDGGALRVRNKIYATVFDIAWIKEHLPPNWTRSIFTVGGTVEAGEGIYITRKADNDLRGWCLASDYAYVLNSPQSGKSSLILHTAERLASDDIRAAVVSLEKITGEESLTAEIWYPRLLDTIAEQLLLETNVAKWWHERPHLNAAERLTSFFQECVLSEVQSPLVIFVDEIEQVVDRPFASDFFSAIGHLYANRARVPSFKRLSFVLSGTTDRRDLIRDPQGKPVKIERQIDLADWTETEALPLAEGLGLQANAARQVLKWALTWTGGHPYLTQRLCQAITTANRGEWSQGDVNRLVASTFFGEQSTQDPHLRSVHTLLSAPSPYGRTLLKTYREIHRDKSAVPDDDLPVKRRLKLAGVIRSDNGVLRVRNPIYERVFGPRWIRHNAPVNWGRVSAVAVLVLLCCIALVIAGLYAVNPADTVKMLTEVVTTIGEWIGIVYRFIRSLFQSIVGVVYQGRSAFREYL